MNIISTLSVLPRLPSELARLEELAYNLWWSWHPEAQQLYERINPELWEKVIHNPVKLLHRAAQADIDRVAGDAEYMASYAQVMAAFDAYMNPDAGAWFKRTYPERTNHHIAYFSAEFGLHEALPIYSGGLGVLSGDHCKAASDLGVPLIGVGFLYPQGYFTQRIDAAGQQIAEYERIDFDEAPASPALDAQGRQVLISVDLPGRVVYARVWRVQVGRVPIYLMDTDVERNAPQDRELSARLYGGDREMRISQEIVLGIGGVRAVRALGYTPDAWHMNEGHSAFLGLERVREMVQEQGLSFDEAVEVVRSNTLFTTHTPVPAGNDAFGFELIDKFFWQYWGQLGVDRERFIAFARQELDWGPQYSMTVLALRLSGRHNGVSKLHGRVSRDMWKFLWPDTPVDEVPIGHITNGVHTATWLAAELRDLYARYLPEDWLESVHDDSVWADIDRIPSRELWQVHQARKQALIDLVRRRARKQYLRHGEGAQVLGSVDNVLNPDALTIGFARRFATYKRANLVFRDVARIRRLLDDEKRPVQFVFAGKAHPADEPGKALIREIYGLSQQPEYAGKIVFVEDYDMNLARALVSGVDLWMNTPRRPREASGTSGQKAALCGAPNFSILDGWWVEGYNGNNGWVIGEDREYKDAQTQDEADALSIYRSLEEEIIPLYYGRNEQGVPEGWVGVMKQSIISCAPTYSTQRMVIDYCDKYYMPAAINGAAFVADDFASVRALVAWKRRIGQNWHEVRLEAARIDGTTLHVGETVDLQARLWLPASVRPQDVQVEAVFGESRGDGGISSPAAVPLQEAGREDGAILYRGAFTPATSGKLALGVRVRPNHPLLTSPLDFDHMRWAQRQA